MCTQREVITQYYQYLVSIVIIGNKGIEINNNGELNWHHGQPPKGRKIEIKSHKELMESWHHGQPYNCFSR